MALIEDFKKCTTKKRHKDGRIEINCKLGLWSIESYSESFADKEALNYFTQYRDDGEYD